MCYDKNMFCSLVDQKEKVILAADNFTYSHGVGTVIIKTNECNIELREVLYVPSLKMNFYSVSKAMKYENTVTFKHSFAEVRDKCGAMLIKANLKIICLFSMPSEYQIRHIC